MSCVISIWLTWELQLTIKKVRVSSPFRLDLLLQSFCFDADSNRAIDYSDGQARVKFVAPEILRQARDEKERAAAEKLARRSEAKAAEEAKRLEKLEKAKVSPLEMFRGKSEYTAWDGEGIPTMDSEGVEIAKSKRKKLQKEWDSQKKLNDAHLASQESTLTE